jgi:hypothetical protein
MEQPRTMRDLRGRFEAQGYVLLRNAIPPLLLDELQAAVQPSLAAHKRGHTKPQRHQTVLEPHYFQPAFLDFLNLPPINPAAAEIIGVNDASMLTFVGLALLMGHTEHTALNWHRDFPDHHPDAPTLWELPTGFIQTNTAIFDDTSLWIVPASHARPASAEELRVEAAWPAETRALALPLPEHEPLLKRMPGGQCVRMRAGDSLLYNPLLWHGASYDPGRVRATFHGGWRHPDLPYQLSSMRWGLNHNPWLLQEQGEEPPPYTGSLGRYFGGQLRQHRQLARHFGVDAGKAWRAIEAQRAEHGLPSSLVPAAAAAAGAQEPRRVGRARRSVRGRL